METNKGMSVVKLVSMATNKGAEQQGNTRGIWSKKWQELWNGGSKGRHIFQIQYYVENERKRYGNRMKNVIISRLRIGQTALNYSLYKIGKHESVQCDKCGELETVMHILIECSAYEREIFLLIQELGWLGVDHISLKVLLRNGSRQSRVHEKNI